MQMLGIKKLTDLKALRAYISYLLLKSNTDLFYDIEHAKKFIHISSYIIKRDQYGKKLKSLLIKKVQQGIEVRLIFDHIGSKVTSKRFFTFFALCAASSFFCSRAENALLSKEKTGMSIFSERHCARSADWSKPYFVIAFFPRGT
jgi:hypothetical protein